MRNLPDVLFWLAVLIFFTDAGQTLVEIIHGPQPKAAMESSAPYTPASAPVKNTELKSSW